MSWHATSWATRQTVPDCESKLLLIMLAEHANSHDTHDPEVYTCWPGIERLCRECLLSENTVKSRLKLLVSLGLISIKQRKDEDGRNRSNIYTLMMPPCYGGRPVGGGGSSREGSGVTGRPQEGSRHDPEPVIGTSNKNQVQTIIKGGFTKPSIEEMIKNGSEMQPPLPEDECMRCWAYYESNGWIVGRVPMKNWKAAMIYWRTRSKKQIYQKPNETASEMTSRMLKGIT